MRVMDLIAELEKMPAGATVGTFIEIVDAITKKTAGVFDSPHISVNTNGNMVQLSTFWDESWGLVFKVNIDAAKTKKAKAKKGGAK